MLLSIVHTLLKPSLPIGKLSKPTHGCLQFRGHVLGLLLCRSQQVLNRLFGGGPSEHFPRTAAQVPGHSLYPPTVGPFGHQRTGKPSSSSTGPSSTGHPLDALPAFCLCLQGLAVPPLVWLGPCEAVGIQSWPHWSWPVCWAIGRRSGHNTTECLRLCPPRSMSPHIHCKHSRSALTLAS